jgi:D-glycero-alpha-D-manno-heptose-7-phosphate kinase
MSDSLRKRLMQQPVEASAPCRIDAGGTWDIKAMALPCEKIEPTTINTALNLRTSVHLCPFDDGWMKVTSEGFSRGAVFRRNQFSFKPPFGLFFGAAAHFDAHGLEVKIKSDSPVKSALGGSSTALVALIKALSKVTGTTRISRKTLLHLAYALEDGISGGNCGLQDQAAAVYGGLSQWKWRYGRESAPFERIPLLDRAGEQEFSRRLLVAYSGKSHVSATTNRRWIKGFLTGRTREGWIHANEIVHRIAKAIRRQNWRQVALGLREEMALRKRLTPEALIPITEKLIHEAEKMGCGARFAGAGAGGSIWAIGPLRSVQQLRAVWADALGPIDHARILDCEIDPRGVK